MLGEFGGVSSNLTSGEALWRSRPEKRQRKDENRSKLGWTLSEAASIDIFAFLGNDGDYQFMTAVSRVSCESTGRGYESNGAEPGMGASVCVRVSAFNCMSLCVLECVFEYVHALMQVQQRSKR